MAATLLIAGGLTQCRTWRLATGPGPGVGTGLAVACWSLARGLKRDLRGEAMPRGGEIPTPELGVRPMRRRGAGLARRLRGLVAPLTGRARGLAARAMLAPPPSAYRPHLSRSPPCPSPSVPRRPSAAAGRMPVLPPSARRPLPCFSPPVPNRWPIATGGGRAADPLCLRRRYAGATVFVDGRDPAVLLSVGGAPALRLPQVEAASGARFGDGSTLFWSRGPKRCWKPRVARAQPVPSRTVPEGRDRPGPGAVPLRGRTAGQASSPASDRR